MIGKSALREPLLHFFLLGAALFALYGLLNQNPGYAADEIIVDQARLDMLAANFERTWRRPPTGEEFQGLIDGWVREEILYREGLALGFDEDDPVIRRRVAQKMSFVADGMVPEQPDDAELEAWLRANIDDYRIPAQYSLEQVYIDPSRHGGNLDAVLGRTLANLMGGGAAREAGDSIMLPYQLSSASTNEVARSFGMRFAEALEQLPVGSWDGPVESGYGLHFVKISEVVPARSPELEEVRPALERDLLQDKAQQINEAFYAALRERYKVRIEPASARE